MPTSTSVTHDSLRTPLPRKLRHVFSTQADAANSIVRDLAALRDRCHKHLGDNPHIDLAQVEADVTNLRAEILHGMPYAVCPGCSGSGCGPCKQSGWLPRLTYHIISDTGATQNGLRRAI